MTKIFQITKMHKEAPCLHVIELLILKKFYLYNKTLVRRRQSLFGRRQQLKMFNSYSNNTNIDLVNHRNYLHLQLALRTLNC